jgi:hypothetical protein
MSIFSKGEASNLNPLYDGIIQSLGVSSAEQTYQTAISVIFWISIAISCIMLLVALKTFRDQRERQERGVISRDSVSEADTLDDELLDPVSLDDDSSETSEIKRNKRDAGSIFGMLAIIGGIVVLSLAFKMSDHIMTYIVKDTLPAYNLDSKTDSKIVYAENEIYYTNILQSNYSLLSEGDKQAFKEMLFGDVSKECGDNKTHCDIILNNQLLTKALENNEGMNLSQFLDKYKGSLLEIKLNEEESNRLKQETDTFLAIEKRLLDAEKELFKNTIGDIEQKQDDDKNRYSLEKIKIGEEIEINDDMVRKLQALSIKDKEDIGIEPTSKDVFEDSKLTFKPMANPDVRSPDWLNVKSAEIQKERENEERPELCRKLINLGIVDLIRQAHCEEYLIKMDR